MSDWCNPQIHENIDKSLEGARMIMLFHLEEGSYLISDTFRMYLQHPRPFAFLGKYARLPEVGSGMTFMNDGITKELHSSNMLPLWIEAIKSSTAELELSPWVLDKGPYSYGRVLFKGQEPIFLDNVYLETLEGEGLSQQSYQYFQPPDKTECPVLVRWRGDPVAMIMPIRVQHPEMLIDGLKRSLAKIPKVAKMA